MSIFNKRTGGFMDEIRCDQPAYLIWKWHPAGAEPGNNNRENAIRWGSSLRVKDGEVAVFVYNHGDGKMQDFIEGPYDDIIKTKNFPILASIVGLAYEGGTPFQAEIYFINLSKITQVQFGVPFFNVYDPRFSDFGVPVAVRGTISFKISDYKQFIKLHRMNRFSLEDFKQQVKDALARYIKDVVANIPAKHNIPLIQIENKTAFIADEVELYVVDRFNEDFGVDVSAVDIGTVEIDKTGNEYRQLMAVTKDVTSATIQAQKEATVKNIHDKQRVDIENYEGILRLQREEGQYAIHKQTQTTNLPAYQVETQTEVGVAGATALGQMGSNGAGDIDLGGDGGSGFNMAALMASMAVGGAVGQNIAGSMNNMMNGVGQPPQQQASQVPPIPSQEYHLTVNGQAMGPYSIATLTQMAGNGQLNKDSLVWKNGMADWKKASEIEELSFLFIAPPPIPQENK